MAFNDVYRLRLYCNVHSQVVCNVMHFKEDITVLGGSGPANLAAEFRTYMQTSLRARATGDVRFDRVEVQTIIPYGAVPVSDAWPLNTFGTVGGTTPSATLAEVITFWTGQIGRRKRGRIYLTGALASRMNNGLYSSAQTALTQTVANNLLARYCKVPYETSYVLGVFSRAIGGQVPPFSTDGFTPVTSMTVRTVIRNQRRRQFGVGV